MTTPSAPEHSLWREYRNVILIAAIVGLVSAGPVYLLRKTAPWMGSAAIGFGGVCVAISEALRWRSECAPKAPKAKLEPVKQPEPEPEPEPEPVSVPEGYEGLRVIGGRFLVNVKAPNKERGQGYLFDSMKPNQEIRRLKLFRDQASGEEYAVIGADRFVEMMVSQLISEADKASEVAMRTAWKRFGKAAGDRSDLKLFMEKTVLETIKSDFRGNILAAVSRIGESVVKKLEKSRKEETKTKTPA